MADSVTIDQALARRAVLGGGIAAVAALALARRARARGPDSFAPLVRKVMPSVVNIAVTETVVAGNDPLAMLPPEVQRQLRERFRQLQRHQEISGVGSGFIIDPAGYIVTNNHVVGTATRIVVSLSDGTRLPAKLVGGDELTDVALIKVDAPHALPAARFADSAQVEVGDWVIAAGNPFGLGGSVAAGIVSARGRDIGASVFDDFLQIDAPINPGNSGGPLFNTDGDVVGMNTAIFSPTGSSVGIGFAIPSDVVSRIVAELRSKGRVERGWLGVSLQDVQQPDGPKGVGVAAVERGGPAARGGLRPGDIIVAVNGETVDGARALIRAVAATAPGNRVRLTVRRQGGGVDLTVTVGRRPNVQEN
ncbi:MAG: trypsin-like peptidase domain-containing protein [Acetobacteraceae bacterium]|nr:trypsin-like peptidase domain-containing protein [Acetobacteraceae bacterium]